MNLSTEDGSALSLPLLSTLHLGRGDSMDGGMSYQDDQHDDREHDDRPMGSLPSGSPHHQAEGYIWTPNGSPRFAQVSLCSLPQHIFAYLSQLI